MKAVNDAPVANPDTVNGTEDTTLTIPLSTLFANDSNGETVGENDPIRFVTAIKASGFPGTLTADGNNLIFTPKANFFGTTSFTYTIEDSGKLRSSAVVTLKIANVNDAPTISGATLNALSGTTVSAVVNASDIDSSFSVAVATRPAHGVASVAYTDGNFVVSYKSSVGYVGTDTFTLVAKDASSVSEPATFKVNVTGNSAPEVLTVAPVNKNLPNNQPFVLTQNVKDANGNTSISSVYVTLSDSSTRERQGLGPALWYWAAKGTFSMRDDSGNWMTPVPLGQTLSNSVATVTLRSSDISLKSDGILQLRWQVAPKAALTGTKYIWSRVEDTGTLSDGFKLQGSLVFSGSASTASVPPSSTNS